MMSCATFALALGHHLTILTMVPAIAFVVLTDARRALSTRNLGVGAVFLALGSLQYTYLFWRTSDPSTPYLESQVSSLGDLRQVLSGAQFKGLFLAFGPQELLEERLPMFWHLLVREYHLLGLLAICGLVVCMRRDWRLATFLLLVLAGSAAFALEYAIDDIFAYFLPVYLVIAVFLGLGFDAVLSFVARDGRLTLPIGIRASALLAIPILLIISNAPRVDQSENTADNNRVEEALRVVGRDGLLVSPDYYMSELFWYHLIGREIGGRQRIYLPGHGVPPSLIASYLRGESEVPARTEELRAARLKNLLLQRNAEARA